MRNLIISPLGGAEGFALCSPNFFQRSRCPLFQSQIITSAITSRLNNGGGIYTLNPQPGSKIHNNWFDDAARCPSGGAIYPDQASANIDIYNNVCSNTKIYCLFINTVDTVTVHDNWSSNPNQVFLRPGTYSTVSNTVAISGALSNWPSGAQAVANNAGIDSEKVWIHALRHYFVTVILKQAGNLKLAQDLARHSIEPSASGFLGAGDFASSSRSEISFTTNPNADADMMKTQTQMPI